MENKEKIKSKAKKLKALADRGVGGEKEAAQRMYDEYIKKHNINESDIDPSKNNRKFRVKNYDDSLILNNVILSVNPFTKIHSENLFVECDLDDEDFNEVKEKFRYFVKLYRVERELLNMAFFSKHQKFFTPDEQANKKWRESHNVNEDLRKAREKAEKMTKKAEKDAKKDIDKEKPKELSKEQIAKMNNDSKIQMLNLSRMGKLTEILLDSKYVRTNRTIETKEKTK